MTTHEAYLAAEKAIAEGEARNLSATTMRKRWKAYFAAEDALKAGSFWMTK